MSTIRAVPTNIITGFLGVGKTTAILQLLKRKPENENWAVLVNEFGEIGIDGALIAGNNPQESGVFIREVPGGCMCCASGVPMQIALNMLLAKAKPDRLLIEPSGLGHPKEVLALLQSVHYREVLSLQATITLIDARKLQDSRYTEHAIFKQQLDIADIIVANKADLYQKNDLEFAQSYLTQQALHQGSRDHSTPFYSTTNGALEIEWLNSRPRLHHIEPEDNKHVHDKTENSNESFESVGLTFDADKVFKRLDIYSLLCGIEADRVKAVFITDEGIFAYNKADNTLSEYMLDESPDSRIEVIGTHINTGLEAYLQACMMP